MLVSVSTALFDQYVMSPPLVNVVVLAAWITAPVALSEIPLLAPEVLRFALTATLLPVTEIGPVMLIAFGSVIPTVLVLLPMVSPPRSLPNVMPEVENADVKLVPKEVISSAPAPEKLFPDVGGVLF